MDNTDFNISLYKFMVEKAYECLNQYKKKLNDFKIHLLESHMIIKC